MHHKMLRGNILACLLFIVLLIYGHGCNNTGDKTYPTLASIEVSPHNPRGTAGNTRQFTATGTYSDSSTKDLTASATWASSNTTIATIDNAGLSSMISAGTTTITATSSGVSGSTTQTITAAASQPLMYGLKLEADAMQSTSLTELHFQMAQDLGLGFMKVVVPMDMVVKPPPAEWDWTVTDRIAASAQSRGISLIPMFLSSDYYLEGKQTDAPAFANFVHSYVYRYKDIAKIEYVEFQNEPNQFNDGTGWKGEIPVPKGSWQGTAEQLVAVDNAAYEKLKAAFPSLTVGSAGFISESNLALDLYTMYFLNRYFAAQPKFDVFMYHYYPKNSSYAQGDSSSALASGWHVFEGYRSLLEQMGYGAKPIFVAEGYVDTPFLRDGIKVWNWVDEDMASVLWVEGFLRVLASSNASNVTGHVFSGAWGIDSSVTLEDATGYKRKQYYVVKLLLESLRRFPIYSRKIAGAANDGGFWIEEFKDAQGKRLWVCLNPILYQTRNDLQVPPVTSYTWTFPQSVTLDVSPAAAVTISTTSGTQLVTTAGGSVTLTIGAEPIIVEE